MKMIRFGPFEWSKVILGTNPIHARSHFSAARDHEYRLRFDRAGIESLVQHCRQLGINTLESSASEGLWEIIEHLRKQGGGPLHFIGNTRTDDTSTMKTHREKLDFLIHRRAELCIIHAQYVEHRDPEAMGPGLKKFIEVIHAAGLLAGVSTHKNSVVEYCEKNHYGVDTYLFPLNSMGFVYPGYDGRETVQQRIDLIRGTPKPFILIKTLAAGRIPPEEGLSFALENSKPEDLINLGVGTIQEATEAVGIVERWSAKH